MTDIVQFTLRLPSGLHDSLKTMANKSRRSLNWEIIVHLETVVAKAERQPRRRQIRPRPMRVEPSVAQAVS